MDYAVAAVFATIIILAFACGRVSANKEWVRRARKTNRVAHHYEGKFYYVIPEPELIREWMQRKDKIPDFKGYKFK